MRLFSSPNPLDVPTSAEIKTIRHTERACAGRIHAIDAMLRSIDAEIACAAENAEAASADRAFIASQRHAIIAAAEAVGRRFKSPIHLPLDEFDRLAERAQQAIGSTTPLTKRRADLHAEREQWQRREEARREQTKRLARRAKRWQTDENPEAIFAELDRLHVDRLYLRLSYVGEKRLADLTAEWSERIGRDLAEWVSDMEATHYLYEPVIGVNEQTHAIVVHGRLWRGVYDSADPNAPLVIDPAAPPFYMHEDATSLLTIAGHQMERSYEYSLPGQDGVVAAMSGSTFHSPTKPDYMAAFRR